MRNDLIESAMEIKKYIDDLNVLMHDLEQDVKHFLPNKDLRMRISTRCGLMSYSIEQIQYVADRIGNSAGD